MTDTIFKKTLFLSLLGHLTLFSLFSFTFGNRINRIDYGNASFLGAILRGADLNSQPFPISSAAMFIIKNEFNKISLAKAENKDALAFRPYFKPPIDLPINQEKAIFMQKEISASFIQKRVEPVIMFYPPIPYHFLLYFRDRQRVHIELMFNIISKPAKANSILVKRKISSGNLEADLLSMRYMSHYLFIQQARFIPDNWQTVKIDLSAKNDSGLVND